MSFKLNKLVAATLTGTCLLGFGANAMADSTEDILNALVAKGVMSEDQAVAILKGSEAEKAEAAKPKEFDFINADAPFKYNFSMGGHEADIQLYGVIDVAGAHDNHSLPPNGSLPNNLYPYQGAKTGVANVSSRSAWINGGLQDSRIGLKGGIDLFKLADNKIKFIYQLETGFNPLTGELNNAAKTLAENSGTGKNSSVNADSSLNGAFFARQAWGGLDGGSLGKLTAGIQYNPVYDILGAYDPTGKADTFSPFGESGTVGGGGGISENSRMKNSIKYANVFAAPMDGKINAAVIYQFGNASGDTSHGYGATAQVGYENSLFGVQLAYDKFTDSPKAGNGATYDTISAGLYDTDSFLAAVKLTPTKDLTFSGGWEWYKYTASSDAQLNYGSLFGYQVTPNGVVKSAFTPGTSQDNNVYFIGAKFDFAERVPVLAGLSTSLGYYASRFDGYAGAAANPSKQGSIDTTTFVADYKFNKRFDTYFAYSTNHFSGPNYATNYSNVDIYGVGIRMKF
jgi:predicted porin